MREKPLHSVRVPDLTRLLPGPVRTLRLGYTPADVERLKAEGVA